MSKDPKKGPAPPASPPKKAPAGPASLLEHKLRQAMSTSPLSRIAGFDPLPAIQAPSLDGLSVQPPPLPKVTEEELTQRFAELCRRHLDRRPRQTGEAIVYGDELLVTLIGYSGGAIIPFTAKEGISFTHAPGAYLAGFAEAMQGAKVGEEAQVRLTLPPDFGVAVLRGKPAVFAVQVSAAIETTPTDAATLGSSAFLVKLGRGETLEKIMASLSGELLHDKALAWRKQTLELVLEQLLARAQPSIPDKVIDQEIGRRWQAIEGELFAKLNLPPKDQEAALRAWLDDARLRGDMKRTLSFSQVMQAVAEAEKIAVTEAEATEYSRVLVEQSGAPEAEVVKALSKNPRAGLQIGASLLMSKVSDLLLERCVNRDP